MLLLIASAFADRDADYDADAYDTADEQMNGWEDTNAANADSAAADADADTDANADADADADADANADADDTINEQFSRWTDAQMRRYWCWC